MNLRHLTDHELCDLYGRADEATQKAIEVECDRRDARDRRRTAGLSPWRAAVAEWAVWAEAQYIAAEDFCRGHMLSKAGRAAGIDPRNLWSGRASTAARYASEELLEFWAGSPRLTRTEYAEALAASRRAERHMALAT